MSSADLSTCEASGPPVMVLRERVDVMDAASAAFALSVIAQLINVLLVHACAEDAASSVLRRSRQRGSAARVRSKPRFTPTRHPCRSA
jgi:hypothetical protein